MYSKKYSGLSILLILALMVSMLAVLVPAAPAQASATAAVINQPTTDNVTLTKGTGGSVTVKYYLMGTGAPETVHIYITNGTTNIFDSGNLSRNSDSTLNSEICAINAATAGNYYLNVYVNSVLLTSQSGTTTVIIDNTAPSVSIALPNASSCWKGGIANTVQWAASDAASTDPVTIYAYLSTDSGSTYDTYPIRTGISYAQGSQIYSYSAPGVTSSTCKVLVYAVDRAGNISENVTTSLFSILNSAPTPIVTLPNGGEIWDGGTSHNITGTVTFTGSSFQYLLSLSTNSGATWSENITSTWVTVTSTSPYTLTYPWTVSNSVRSSTCRIRLLARDCALNVGTDTSNADFRIKDVTAPTVTVTAPTTGQTWYAGIANNITWTQTDNIPGNLLTTIYYSTDGSEPTLLIFSDTSYAQGSNSYAWSIPPGTNSTNCKIKIVAKDGETPVNTSTPAYSGPFTISSGGVPSVTLCTPNGGESWQVGSIQTITWTCSDSLDATARMTYVILLSTNGGSTWPIIIATLSNQTQSSSCGGSYSWAVSDNASATAMIKITATNVAGASSSDASNAVFTISSAGCAVETGTVTLYPGWNLMSLPLIPSTTSIDTVLSSVMPYIVSVWYYSGGSSGAWYSYAPGAPSLLTDMYDRNAYWIYMSGTSPTTYTLSFQGRKFQCPTNPLSPTYTMSTLGWNMVGFKSTINKTVSTYMTSMGTCGSAYLAPISGWNAQTGTALSANCSDNMIPGHGYWIYINTAGTIVPGTD